MKHLLPFAVTLLALAPMAARAQVGVGTPTPDAKSALDIRATDKGLLIPRLTAAQRTAITSPPQGLMVYQTDGTASGGTQTGFWYYAGAPAQWVFLNPAASADNLGNGVAATNVNLNGNKLVGGTAASPSLDGVQVSGAGQVGIGLGAATPTERLQVDGGNLKLGAAQWTSTANDRQLRFGDGNYVAVGETGGDDLLQLQAKDFRFNPSPDSPYTGNVGIGLGAAVAPAEQLEVGGNVKITGTAGTEGLIFPDGTKQFTAATTGGGGLTLPYSGSANPATSGPVFSISNTGSGIGLRGASASGQGVVGRVNGTGPGQGVVGVKGTNVPNIADAAVVGLSEADYGVYAYSKSESGVVGTTDATTNAVAGVQGSATSGATGVRGESSSGLGVNGSSITNVGINGTSGNYIGVRGSTAGDGAGVAGVVGRNTGSSGIGVYGTSHGGVGVFGDVDAPDGSGILGQASQTNGTAVVAVASGPATAFKATTTGTGPAAYISQSSTTNSAVAVTIRQRGTGPALVLDNNGPGYSMGMGLGIGTSFPRTQLSITPATTEAKITLYDGNSSTDHYGFGVSGSQLNYHVIDANARHVFYAGGKNGNGTELLRIQGNGRVGIGTNNPQAPLDVAGTVRAVEVNTPATGTANLVPLAYGRVAANGTILSGTGNFTVSLPFAGTGYYEVNLTGAGASLDLTGAICVATGLTSTSQGVTVATASGTAGGEVDITTNNMINNTQPPRDFSFVIYRP